MEETYPGSRVFVSQALIQRGVPEEAVHLLLSSITNTTLKQYNTELKKWWKFSRQNAKDPFIITVEGVLIFLNKLFIDGASYGTLNSARSALSLISTPEVSSDFRIKRLLKGVQHLKPSKPRYDSTWDPSTVLTYLSNFYPNDTLSLERITKKLVVSLALITGHRLQTLSLTDINNIIQTESGFEIRITHRIKTSGKNCTQPVLLIPFYEEKPEVCVASTLSVYLEKTKLIRTMNKTKLFLCYKKPFGVASTATISRWIKSVLADSGIDTTIFSAYSTRHAATSAAKRKGISWDVIRNCAGWSQKSHAFAVFYNRPLCKKGEFAKAILK